jgi:hypothetical protein
LLPASSKLVDNLGQEMGTQLVDGLSADLLQDEIFASVLSIMIKKQSMKK